MAAEQHNLKMLPVDAAVAEDMHHPVLAAGQALQHPVRILCLFVSCDQLNEAVLAPVHL